MVAFSPSHYPCTPGTVNGRGAHAQRPRLRNSLKIAKDGHIGRGSRPTQNSPENCDWRLGQVIFCEAVHCFWHTPTHPAFKTKVRRTIEKWCSSSGLWDWMFGKTMAFMSCGERWSSKTRWSKRVLFPGNGSLKSCLFLSRETGKEAKTGCFTEHILPAVYEFCYRQRSQKNVSSFLQHFYFIHQAAFWFWLVSFISSVNSLNIQT